MEEIFRKPEDGDDSPIVNRKPIDETKTFRVIGYEYLRGETEMHHPGEILELKAPNVEGVIYLLDGCPFERSFVMPEHDVEIGRIVASIDRPQDPHAKPPMMFTPMGSMYDLQTKNPFAASPAPEVPKETCTCPACAQIVPKSRFCRECGAILK